MATVYSPNIITNGLILALDAANPKSYPGEGTTWYDKSGNGNNATLYNGLAYEQSTKGIIMDGGDEYLRVPHSSTVDNLKTSNFTIETIVRSDNVVYPRSRHPLKLGHTVTSSTTAGFSVGHGACSNYIQVRVGDGTNMSYTNINHTTVPESTYWHRIFTVDRSNGCLVKHYINGVYIGQLNATNVTGAIYNQNSSDFGGDGIIFGYVWGWRYIGSINRINIYNKTFSEVEILQNYNATKERFGL